MSRTKLTHLWCILVRLGIILPIRVFFEIAFYEGNDSDFILLNES